MPFQDIVTLFAIWSVTLLVGWINIPFAYLLFGKLSDKGYTLSKLVGLFAVSYVFFALASFKIVPLAIGSLAAIATLWALVNFLLARRLLPKSFSMDVKQMAGIEAFFFLFMVVWLFVRGHVPAIYEIERFMDFGFIQALFNTNTLPLQDIWFAGAQVNYYYFGHFMAYTLLSLAGVAPTTGFLALVVWMFGLLAVNVYRLGKDLFHFFTASPRLFWGIGAGVVSVFSVLLAGTWHTVQWFLHSVFNTILNLPTPSYWYPEPTRIIPGTITEMPFYGFIVSDLHAHMWGLLTGIAIVTLLAVFWFETQLSLKRIIFYTASLAFLLAIAFMTNSWEALTLGVLSLLVVGIQSWKHIRYKTFAVLALLPIAAYAFALPWKLFFASPIHGIGTVQAASPFLAWLSFWGAFLFLILLFTGKILWHALKRQKLPAIGFHVIVFGVATVFLILLELLYVKDILKDGEWYRANTVFKITIQLWLWVGVLAGPMALWLLLSATTLRTRLIVSCLLAALFLSQSVYPVKALQQTEFGGRTYQGLSAGLQWFQKKYPADYEAYLFLAQEREKLPKGRRMQVIVEGEGESYTGAARFSAYLGWPTVVGWAVHEWTWRGSYDAVDARRKEIHDLYVGYNVETAKATLQKYGVTYIIVGEIEYALYGNFINTQKLLSLGTRVFEQGRTMVLKVR